MAVVLPVYGQAAGRLPQPVGHVSDFAHVMSPATIAKLNELCARVERQAHSRVDVVTVKTTAGESIQAYAANLERAWTLGHREVMVVVAVKQRQRWIAASSGLVKVLPRKELNRISWQMVPMLRKNDFDGALTLAVDELAVKIAKSADVNLNVHLPWQARVAAQRTKHADWLQPVTVVLAVMLVVSFVIWVFSSGLLGAGQRKRKKQ